LGWGQDRHAEIQYSPDFVNVRPMPRLIALTKKHRELLEKQVAGKR